MISWPDPLVDTPPRALSELTTAGVGGTATRFFEPRDEADLVRGVASARARGLPVHVLGGGTNVLAPDGELPGVVVSTRRLGGVAFRGCKLVAGAGAPTAKLVAAATARGLSGLEPLTGIPGTIGGAVFGNAGTRAGDVGSVVSRVRVLDEDGRERWLDREEVRPRYRASDLDGRIVLEVELALEPRGRREVRRRVREMQLHRKSSQPLGRGSLGCFFRNPGEGRSAGELIDRAGLKGTRVGDVSVSAQHANFFLNGGRARSRDFRELAARVQDVVLRRFGVRLEPEVRIWGSAAALDRPRAQETGGIPSDPRP